MLRPDAAPPPPGRELWAPRASWSQVSRAPIATALRGDQASALQRGCCGVTWARHHALGAYRRVDFTGRQSCSLDGQEEPAADDVAVSAAQATQERHHALSLAQGEVRFQDEARVPTGG